MKKFFLNLRRSGQKDCIQLKFISSNDSSTTDLQPKSGDSGFDVLTYNHHDYYYCRKPFETKPGDGAGPIPVLGGSQPIILVRSNPEHNVPVLENVQALAPELDCSQSDVLVIRGSSPVRRSRSPSTMELRQCKRFKSDVLQPPIAVSQSCQTVIEAEEEQSGSDVYKCVQAIEDPCEDKRPCMFNSSSQTEPNEYTQDRADIRIYRALKVWVARLNNNDDAVVQTFLRDLPHDLWDDLVLTHGFVPLGDEPLVWFPQ